MGCCVFVQSASRSVISQRLARLPLEVHPHFALDGVWFFGPAPGAAGCQGNRRLAAPPTASQQDSAEASTLDKRLVCAPLRSLAGSRIQACGPLRTHASVLPTVALWRGASHIASISQAADALRSLLTAFWIAKRVKPPLSSILSVAGPSQPRRLADSASQLHSPPQPARLSSAASLSLSFRQGPACRTS